MRDYQKIRSLGKGSFGQAWLVISKRDKRKYVAKVMQEFTTKEEQEDCIKEAHVLHSLRHENIVAYVDSFQERGQFHIVMEFVDGGDLSELLQRQKRRRSYMPQKRVLNIFWQICKAITYCHDNKTLHRDIKSQNIFLMKSGVVKVGDFGIAKVLDSTTALAQTKIGTPYYLSPEICEDKPYDQKSDVWALGCLLYEMLTLDVPFKAKDMMNLVRMILFKQPRTLPTGVYDQSVQNLVLSLLAKDPRRRPTVKQILQHPLFRVFSSSSSSSAANGDGDTRRHQRSVAKSNAAERPIRNKNSRIRRSEATAYFEKLAHLRRQRFQERQRQRVVQERTRVRQKSHPQGTDVARKHVGNDRVVSRQGVVQHKQNTHLNQKDIIRQDDQVGERKPSRERKPQEKFLRDLASARKQAFEERLALKMKMAGVRGQSSQEQRHEREHLPSSVSLTKRQSAETHRENVEDAYLKQLAVARKEAFAERMALKQKMEGVGGRPKYSARSHSSQMIRQDATKSEESKPLAHLSRTERQLREEAETLRQLREARKQAFADRMALKKKMEGFGGRPIRRSTPTESLSRDVPRQGTEQVPIAKMNKADRQRRDEADMLRQLSEARKQAFADRMALKKKMEGIGGRPVRRTSSIESKSEHRQQADHVSKAERRRRNEAETLQKLADARKQAFADRMALKKKMEGIGGRPVRRHSANVPSFEPNAQTKISKDARKVHDQKREAAEKERLESLARARKQAFAERMALRQKMEAMQMTSSTLGGDRNPPLRSRREKQSCCAQIERREEKEEKDKLKELAIARQQAFEERMALKKKMSSIQEPASSSKENDGPPLPPPSSSVTISTPTPMNRRRSASSPEFMESPGFEFTTPPPPSCGPHKAEGRQLRDYLEAHLGERLLRELCDVLKSGQSAISMMRKVPGGIQRAQHLMPMVQQYCRLSDAK